MRENSIPFPWYGIGVIAPILIIVSHFAYMLFSYWGTSFMMTVGVACGLFAAAPIDGWIRKAMSRT